MGKPKKSELQKHSVRMAYTVNETSICISSGGFSSILLLPDFKNNLGNFLSWAILELPLVIVIETKICEDVWWW